MMVIRTAIVATVLSLVMIAVATSVAFAQLRPPEIPGLRGAPFPSINPPPEVRSYGEGPAWDGKPPEGVQPLPIDMFTSKDFYKDRALWMDQRYWRGNGPLGRLHHGLAAREHREPLSFQDGEGALRGAHGRRQIPRRPDAAHLRN